MDNLLKYFETGKPIIYFNAYGFEDRTTKLLSIIKNKVKLDHAFTIGFASSSVGRTLQWKRNKSFIDDSLSEVANNYDIINTSVKQPVEVRQNLKEKIEKYQLDFTEFNTIIDITSFPKSTLFMLLKELVKSDAAGHIFYTEPIDYELPISRGVKDVRTLPFFGDDYDQKKQKLLIEILGFEGLRAYAIWEHFDPHKTMALIGVPSPENAKWEKISLMENKLLLSRPGVEQRKMSFVDIEESTKILEEIYDEIDGKYNIIVSSLGTKLSTVALLYSANRHANVFVAFSRPEEYTEHYSYGCKRMRIVGFDSESVKNVGSFSF